jgi:NAD(P)-dependent dehydrogenase (short-subunit alcohol dehydrogenase family)
MNILITGVSRGIGAELTKLALEKSYHVYAVARKPNESPILQKLKTQYVSKLQLIAADFLDPAACQNVFAALGTNTHIDVLINNAGILQKADSAKDFQDSFMLNATTPYLMIKTLLPFLKLSDFPKVINITSAMGSIAENQSGGFYSYRSSKAALNMINKSISIDQPWLTSIVMHPGWVQTEMGGAGATLTAQESAESIWKKIQSLKKENSGHFFDVKGRELPW